MKIEFSSIYAVRRENNYIKVKTKELLFHNMENTNDRGRSKTHCPTGSAVECAFSSISCIMIIGDACKAVENDLDVNEDEGWNVIKLTYNCILTQARWSRHAWVWLMVFCFHGKLVKKGERKEETKIFNYLLYASLVLAIASLHLCPNLPQQVSIILPFRKEESVGRHRATGLGS